MNRLLRVSFLACFAVSVILPLSGQTADNDPCAAPTFPKLTHDRNMFNEQQEAWLGDILDEQTLKSYNKIEDPETDYLQKMGERMLAQLPPTGRQYRFFIIDLPINNAFSLGGSRIYVTRQLVAFLKNEDELAGLLSHEIGHIITHQVPIDVTRMFRKVLGVEQVGDRQDIFDKWNRLEDIWQKKSGAFRDSERVEDEQQIADRIGLYAMTRAGYQPLQFADFFDRLTENKGKTGNFLTDFFGATDPNSKRVRLLINKAGALPPQCINSLAANSGKHFLEWQKAVVAARRLAPKEQVAGMLNKVVLNPPLRGSLQYLQFSADGKYLVAQDESSIFVLSRDPLATLFRVEATNAGWAQFSADSRSVVIADAELRIQKWDIATRQRISIQAVTIPRGCLESTVSSTGEVLACIKRHKDDYEVQLLNVSNGESFFSKTINAPEALFSFFGVEQSTTIRYRVPTHFHMHFSPDGRYFLLGSSGSGVAYDLQEKHEISISGRLKQIASSQFTFTANDAIAGFNREKPSRSPLVRFPSGELIEEFPLEINGFKLEGRLIAAAKGPYILVTPAAMHPIAAIDLENKKLAMGYKSPALAIYGDVVAGEQVGGRVALFSLAEKKLLASTQLPLSYLPSLQASGFSSDGKWLAAAGKTSGGVWNAETGDRMMDTGTFTGGFFDQDKILATFDKIDQKPKMIRLDPAQKTMDELYSIDPPAPGKDQKEHERVWQAGNILLVAKPPLKDRITVEAHDARTYNVLWSREFQVMAPFISYSPAGKTLTAIFLSFSTRNEVKKDPVLNQKFSSLSNKDDLMLIEILDPATGKIQNSVFVDTGNYSFVASSAISAGDTLLVHDTSNRTQVYSLKSGQQKGKVLGRCQAISANGERALVENEKGEAGLYDTNSLKLLSHFTFPTRIVHAEFLSDGETLIVLTSDQTLYRVKSPAAEKSASL